jgi:hypothetical protein
MNIPAFPVEMIYTQENEKFNGMTLRDYFAAKAMQGMFNYWDENPNLEFEHIADCSYDMADAMMKARDKDET